jgi:serine/threonine protein kinase
MAPAMDIWSTGVLLQEIHTGKLAYASYESSKAQHDKYMRLLVTGQLCQPEVRLHEVS